MVDFLTIGQQRKPARTYKYIDKISLIPSKREAKLIDTKDIPWNITYSMPLQVKGEHRVISLEDEIIIAFEDSPATCKLFKTAIGNIITCTNEGF